jgi:4-coumarate--CoA ligase
VLGAEPFAVLSSYHGKTKAEIKDHVRTTLGEDYALGGLATLKQLGLLEFPLNPTHKVIKSEVHAAVLQYLKRIAVDSGLENKMEG